MEISKQDVANINHGVEVSLGLHDRREMSAVDECRLDRLATRHADAPDLLAHFIDHLPPDFGLPLHLDETDTQ